jgi:hypothetical protein
MIAQADDTRGVDAVEQRTRRGFAGPCLAPPSRLPSGVIGARLAAYSCGGSQGFRF